MDFNKFSQKLQNILLKANQQASQLRHSEITTVHMFCAIFSDDTIDGLFRRLNIDKQACLKDAENRLNNIATVDYIPQPIFNRKVNDAIIEALNWAKDNDETFLTVATVFIHLLFNDSPISNDIVKKYGLTKTQVINQELERRGGKKMNEATSEENLEALEKYGSNIVEAVADGKVDPVIGRDEEIRRIIEILSRKTKNNPVLIGEPGVGKQQLLKV